MWLLENLGMGHDIVHSDSTHFQVKGRTVCGTLLDGEIRVGCQYGGW